MSGKSQVNYWKKLKEDFEGDLSKVARAHFDQLEYDEFLTNYFKLAEYVVPKLARQELVTDDNNDINININYVKSEADEENEEGIADRD